MANRSTITPEATAKLDAALAAGSSARVAARSAGVSYGAARRAAERIKDRVRSQDEFKDTPALRAPLKNHPAMFSWSLAMIRAARDAQMLGDFRLPAALARAMRTDDALYTAYHNRIAPQSAIEAILVPANGARGERVKCRAAGSVIIPRATLAGINGTLANHGVAFGYNQQEVNDEGTRVDFKLTEWPIEFIRWDRARECFRARVRDFGPEENVVHGDGRWTVFRKFDVDPWTQEACLLPAAILWFAHMSGIRDWALASTSHGQAKILATLPAGVTHQRADGSQTPQARELLGMLQDLVSGESGAAVAPNGTVTEFLANGSTAWQVFKELIENREKAAARIYQGTDATLGAQGGAPGVDIAALFGVATTKIQGDFRAIQDGLRTGVFEPWTAVNYGDSSYAPSLVYLLPDVDGNENVAQIDIRRAAFAARLKELRESGMIVDQDVVTALALEYKIKPPTLAPIASVAVPLTLAPTDIAKAVTINEIRQSQGLPQLYTPRGNMTIPQADAADTAQADAAVKGAPAAPAPGAPA